MSDVGTGRKGSLHRGFAGGRTVRFLAAEVAKLAEVARQQHALEPVAAKLCAEAMVATMLMSAWVKGRERVTVQVHAERPRFAFTADVDSEAGIRARFYPPKVRRVRSDGGIDGYLHAIRSDVKKEIYRGITALDGRTVERALAAHLQDSEQVEGFLRIGVEQDDTGRITVAGGLLVERLPPHDSMPWMSSEDFAHTYGGLQKQPISDLLVALAFGKIADQEIELLENREAHWRCACSMERIEAMLYALGVAELSSMLAEDGNAEVTCHYCNLAYQVPGNRLSALILKHGEQAGAAEA